MRAHPLRLFGHVVRVNLAAGMAYRASFVTQVVGMIINNSAFIVPWPRCAGLEKAPGGDLWH